MAVKLNMIFVSRSVIEEAAAVDAQVARRRLEIGKHIANATMRSRIDAICRAEGYDLPVICTPEELSGD